jgi:hypothetical protein
MKRISLVVAVICVVALPSTVLAASVITTANISSDGPANNGDNEVDIAINPTNADNLIAAWNDYGPGESCGLGFSMNGGASWTTSWLQGVTPDGGNATFDYGGGDPSVGFLSDGTAVLSCAAWGASRSQPSAIFTSRSTDGGRTWAPAQQLSYGRNLGHLQDHNMLTIDRYHDRVLVAYTVWNGYRARSFAQISSDGGRTYNGPYEIAADYIRNTVDRFDVSLTGAPDGTIYAVSGVWQHVTEWNEEAVVVSQMRPGETRFTRSIKLRDLVPAPRTLPGESWRTSMQPSIGVEAGGQVDVLMPDFVTGNIDMYLARSTDHGMSFPSQVNLTHDALDQVMAWLSVTPAGRIDTVFYDYNRTTGLMDAVYGQVAPGGATLTRTVLQSGIDGDVQPPRGPDGTPFMGDYLGVDSTDAIPGASTTPRIAVSWTGNGPASQDVFSATLAP